MSTITFGVLISETTKRYKSQLMANSDSLADVAIYTKSKVSLDVGAEHIVEPNKLFAAFSNNVNILIHITVNSGTIILPLKHWILLPFDETDVVSIKLVNPSGVSSLPAVVSYVTV